MVRRYRFTLHFTSDNDSGYGTIQIRCTQVTIGTGRRLTTRLIYQEVIIRMTIALPFLTAALASSTLGHLHISRLIWGPEKQETTALSCVKLPDDTYMSTNPSSIKNALMLHLHFDVYFY